VVTSSARLRSYHEALSKCVRAHELPGVFLWPEVFSGDRGERAAVTRINNAHVNRLTGKGSPAECDRVAKEVCG